MMSSLDMATTSTGHQTTTRFITFDLSLLSHLTLLIPSYQDFNSISAQENGPGVTESGRTWGGHDLNKS